MTQTLMELGVSGEQLKVQDLLFESAATGGLKPRVLGRTSEGAVLGEAADCTERTGFLGRAGELLLGRGPGAW